MEAIRMECNQSISDDTADSSNLLHACQLEDIERVRDLIRSDRKALDFVALWGITEGDVRILQILAAAGYDLASASISGISLLIISAARGQLDIARYLLSCNANVSAKMPKSGFTALMWAKYMRDTEMVSLLERHGATE